MRKIWIILLALLILTPSVCLAATFRSEKDNAITTVTQAETLKNAYLAGNSVNFSGKATQDLFAAGNTISIGGSVGASLMAAGNTITLSAPVGNSARIAGNNLVIQSSVGSDLMAAGNAIALGPNAQVSDDLIAAGNVLDLAGNVNGNALLAGSQININGQIKGDVTIKGSGKVVIGDNAVIGGNLNYEAAEPATIAAGAKIAGTTNFKKVARQTGSKNMMTGKLVGLVTFFSLGALIATFLTLWLLTYIFPKLTRRYLEAAMAKPAESIGMGFVYLVVVPVAAIILLVTLIGIPLSILVFGTYGVAVAIAKLFVPVFVGSLLFKWFGKSKEYRIDWLTILIGIVATAIIGAIPFIGGLALLLVFLMAFAQIAINVTSFIKAER